MRTTRLIECWSLLLFDKDSLAFASNKYNGRRDIEQYVFSARTSNMLAAIVHALYNDHLNIAM